MGLDMYLKKITLFDGLSFEKISEMKEEVNFLRDYENIQNTMKDFDKNYNPNYFWTVVGESPEQKKERIRSAMTDFLSSNLVRYTQLKDKFTAELKERLMNLDKVEVGYWRKANHIHNWFVENVQNGVDDCDSYVVSREKLQELYDTCNRAVNIIQDFIRQDERYASYSVEEFIEQDLDITELETFDESKLRNLLPTTEGFFFGSTAYDSWYVSDILHTINVLRPILENNEDENIVYIYTSSW